VKEAKKDDEKGHEQPELPTNTFMRGAPAQRARVPHPENKAITRKKTK